MNLKNDLDGDSWIDKAWGRSRTIVDSYRFRCCELLVEAKSYCSLHSHESAANLFCLVEGRMDIITLASNEIQCSSLNSGDVIVPSGVLHMFVAYDDCRLYESYYPDGGPNTIGCDINRLFISGKFSDGEIDQLFFDCHGTEMLDVFGDFDKWLKNKVDII